MVQTETYKFILDVKKTKLTPTNSLPIVETVRSGTIRKRIAQIKKDFLKDHYSVKVRNIKKRK